MRKIVILASAACALCACQTPESLQRQAAANCEAVGITQKDPQFKTCSAAWMCLRSSFGVIRALSRTLKARNASRPAFPVPEW